MNQEEKHLWVMVDYNLNPSQCSIQKGLEEVSLLAQ